MNYRRLSALPLSLLVTALLAHPSSGAQEGLPATDRARIEGYGAAYVEALAGGGAEASSAAIARIFAPSILGEVGVDRLAAQMARLRGDLGSLTLHHAELVENSINGSWLRSLHVYVHTSGRPEWRDLQFRLEAEPPYKLTQLLFIAEVTEPVYLPNGAITDPSTLEWLSHAIDRFVEQNDLAGSVLIARGGEPLLERVFGFADVGRAHPVTAETRFNLASGNKMFTALAVAQLVEQGRLAYSDSIAPFFPDFPDPGFARRVTVGNLLSHTSGVSEFWTAEYEAHWQEIRTVAQMLPWVYRAGTDFEPGTRFGYSNSNFILAGLIVEQVAGVDYFDYIRDHIYRPLGMVRSDTYLRDGSVPDLATPLSRDGNGGWREAVLGLRGSSAGGGYSTARDMLRFARGLVSGKLVSPQSLEALTTSKVAGLEPDIDYGYGFELSRQGGVRSFGHGGIARGTNFAFEYFPDLDVAVVLFSNQDNGAYDDLHKYIVRLVTGAR
jgi:CubicO group peptidase (beta-lactamase class C family)